MQLFARDIKRLIDEALKIENLSADPVGFSKMTTLLNKEQDAITFSDRYLSENLYSPSKKALEKAKAGEDPKIGANISYVNVIARFLDFQDFNGFLLGKKKTDKSSSENLESDPRLDNLLGNWFSYVRGNSGDPEIFAAQVEIYREGEDGNGAYKMRLYGLGRNYEGLLSISNSSLVTTLFANQGKFLNLIFHIGHAIRPSVIQGVFSGVSTAGKPIAGREILVRDKRENVEFEKSKVIDIPTDKTLDPRILKYFDSYEGNCLRAGDSSSFTLKDLDL